MNTQHTSGNNAKKAINTAMEMVSALCMPRGTEGARSWTMSIPARRDYDPDLVIAHGLRLAQAEIERLEKQRDELRAAAIKARRALAHADSKSPGLYGAEYAELDKAIDKAGGK